LTRARFAPFGDASSSGSRAFALPFSILTLVAGWGLVSSSDVSTRRTMKMVMVKKKEQL
jgi:hypothetical protein